MGDGLAERDIYLCIHWSKLLTQQETLGKIFNLTTKNY